MHIKIPVANSPDPCFEVLRLSCIQLLARGSSRDVYEIPSHPDKVLKVSNLKSNAANWTEILVFGQLSDGGALAKIHSWSWSGKFIVMERLSILKDEDLDLSAVPYFLSDRKRENFGKDASGMIKALDYALVKFGQPTPSAFL